MLELSFFGCPLWCSLHFCIRCLVPGGWRSLPTQVPKSSGSRWLGGEGYGRPGLALGPPFSFPHSFFLSCLLLWPEEMEWAGGGPLSSHPLPEPKSGVTLPPPRARPGEKLALQGKCLEPLPELGPSALPPRSPAQSLRASPLPPFRPLFWKEQSHSAWPCPCSCPSCHIVLPLPREAAPPHQAAPSRLSRLAAGGGTFCVSSLPLSSSSLRLREVPWRAHVTQPIRRRI